MTKRIDYPRVVASRAIHKHPNQSGLHLQKLKGSPFWQSDNSIRLEAINPKTNTITTGLYLEIPVESVSDLIQALQELL